ncbi:unnamed protein product [Danaus chrysippus]|uniref:(African queen) hypothetical protein n=1 Tax=Danaus chrysippus TaxID=151541 RepID=A0A8J2QJ82_9NEOP|nr:unnamed protein product [Danaus chrysippus]
MEDYRGVRMLPVSARRKDLRKHNLTMANVITDSNETRQHLDDRLNLHQDSITKMSYVVAKICFDMLNATENRIFTHTWGYKDKNGNWQGIIDHLLKKKADLGTLTIFTQERMKAIDYIAMVGSTAVRFVFREPPLALLENIFTLPFTSAVWIAIVICVLGCALFLYITSKWEATVGMHPLQLSGSWADVLILIIGAVLQQGCTLEPRYAAGRCVTLLLFVSLTVLFAAYSANIVVLLRAPSSSVRSLPDLLNSPLKLGASDFEYNRYFFKKLNDPIRKAIYSKKIAPAGKKPNFYSMKEGVEKIRKGLFAFHMELNPGYRLIQETYQEEEKCDLVEIDYINEIDPWLPGQKRSPYKDLFKIRSTYLVQQLRKLSTFKYTFPTVDHIFCSSFIKIRESGVQSCVHHRLHVGRPRCSGSISTFSSVGITDMYPALQATLYGAFMSIAVLMMEKVHYKLELRYDVISKLSYVHVQIAFQMLNATPRHVFSHRWGYKKNGQWSGMINDLNTGRADLGTNCVPNAERLSVVVFTDSIAKFEVKFIFRQPPLSYVSNIFTLPFSKSVWIAIAVSFAISTITIYIATKWEVRTFKTDPTQLDGSVFDAMLITMSALSQQGCSKEPKKFSGRVMSFVIFSALMAVYTAYSANIMVLLQAPSSAITNLEQLANSDMKIAAHDVDYNHFVLKAQKDPIRKAIYRKISPEKGKKNFYDFNEGVELLRQGLFAFHAILELVYLRVEETFLENEKCDLMQLDFINSHDPFVPIYKHSPYLELLRVVFKRIRESGIQMANHRRFLVPKPRCTEKMSTFSSVGLVHMKPVLLFIIYGFCAAFLIMLAEIFVYKIKMCKRKEFNDFSKRNRLSKDLTIKFRN